LQSLLVEFLLVERPSELIESELVELGGEAAPRLTMPE